MYSAHYPDAACKASAGTVKHDPPLLFNLNYDPGELNPLNTTESPYNEIVKTINKVSIVLIIVYQHMYVMVVRVINIIQNLK